METDGVKISDIQTMYIHLADSTAPTSNIMLALTEHSLQGSVHAWAYDPAKRQVHNKATSIIPQEAHGSARNGSSLSDLLGAHHASTSPSRANQTSKPCSWSIPPLLH